MSEKVQEFIEVVRLTHTSECNYGLLGIWWVCFPQICKISLRWSVWVPHERVQQRIDEQFVDVPTPQIMENIVKCSKIVPLEHTHFGEDLWTGR